MTVWGANIVVTVTPLPCTGTDQALALRQPPWYSARAVTA